ncbi:MAG TPA: hypothetical protein VD927_15365 [Chryseosolibacter sp.]|nr:hypothetical protein [Chryseosolibacter sp.]
MKILHRRTGPCAFRMNEIYREKYVIAFAKLLIAFSRTVSAFVTSEIAPGGWLIAFRSTLIAFGRSLIAFCKTENHFGKTESEKVVGAPNNTRELRCFGALRMPFASALGYVVTLRLCFSH